MMEVPASTRNGRFKTWTIYLAFNFIVLISISSVDIQNVSRTNNYDNHDNGWSGYRVDDDDYVSPNDNGNNNYNDNNNNPNMYDDDYDRYRDRHLTPVVFLGEVTPVTSHDLKAIKGWGIALSTISLLLTLSTSGIHLHPIYRSLILNTKYELYIIIALLILWTSLVAIVSSPTSGLAVYDDGAVYLGNMYYFTWAGFISGVVLLASFVESFFGISVSSSFRNHNLVPNGDNDGNDNGSGNGNGTQTENNSNANGNTNINTNKSPSMVFIYWSALMVSSLIVMGTSADIYNRTCEIETNLKPQPFCSRTVFAISTGTISVISSLVVIISKLLYITIPFLIEICLCTILFVLYIMELVYVTGVDGPGSPLGNLYYFSWIAFMLCFGIGKCCYEDYVQVLENAELEFQEDVRRRGESVGHGRNYDEENVVVSTGPGGLGFSASGSGEEVEEEDRTQWYTIGDNDEATEQVSNETKNTKPTATPALATTNEVVPDVDI
jgi:hypothetical protein